MGFDRNPNKDYTATVLFDEKENLVELLQPIKKINQSLTTLVQYSFLPSLIPLMSY